MREVITDILTSGSGRSEFGWTPSSLPSSFSDSASRKLEGLHKQKVIHIRKSIKFCIYSEFSAKIRVEILHVSVHLFISLHQLGSLTLVSLGVNVSYFKNFIKFGYHVYNLGYCVI